VLVQKASPPQALIRSPEDAELAAAAALRWLGHRSCSVTPPGPDGGIDVSATDAVAQVKTEMSPTGRPVLQSIHGAAQVERKTAYCFSLAGYTDGAIEWAHRAGIRLFRFDMQGQAEPVNIAAQLAVARRSQDRRPLSDGDRLDPRRLSATFGLLENVDVYGVFRSGDKEILLWESSVGGASDNHLAVAVYLHSCGLLGLDFAPGDDWTHARYGTPVPMPDDRSRRFYTTATDRRAAADEVAWELLFALGMAGLDPEALAVRLAPDSSPDSPDW